MSCITSKIEAKMNDGLFPDNNQIIGNFEFYNSKVWFEGKNNILIAPDTAYPAKLMNTIISFKGDNSVVFLGRSKEEGSYQIDLQIYSDCNCYIGANTSFNGYSKVIDIVCAEATTLFIGDDCGIANAVRFQLTDSHPIYGAIDQKRKNYAKDIIVGDHVWIGPEVKVLKGSRIGSGSIIALNTIVAGDTIPSNTVWGGAQRRVLKGDVFYTLDVTNSYSFNEIEKNSYYYNDDRSDFIFSYDSNNTFSKNFLENIKLLPVTDRVNFFIDLYGNKGNYRSRLFIPME